MPPMKNRKNCLYACVKKIIIILNYKLRDNVKWEVNFAKNYQLTPQSLVRNYLHYYFYSKKYYIHSPSHSRALNVFSTIFFVDKETMYTSSLFFHRPSVPAYFQL